MRHLTIALALLIAIGVVGYVLVTPAFLGDFRSLLLTGPFVLLLAREIYEHVPPLVQGYATPQAQPMILVPVEDDLDADQPSDDVPVDGLWLGNVQVWPRRSGEVLRLYSIQLSLSTSPPACELIPNLDTGGRHIASVELVEWDEMNGNLDLRLVADDAGREEKLDARLRLSGARLVPEDDSDPVTVQLVRAQLSSAFGGALATA